jgi:hypothetical protein
MSVDRLKPHTGGELDRVPAPPLLQTLLLCRRVWGPLIAPEIRQIKGIVSQDWGRMQIVLLDRSEVRTIPLDVYFQSKIHFSIEFFQNGVTPGLL